MILYVGNSKNYNSSYSHFHKIKRRSGKLNNVHKKLIEKHSNDVIVSKCYRLAIDQSTVQSYESCIIELIGKIKNKNDFYNEQSGSLDIRAKLNSIQRYRLAIAIIHKLIKKRPILQYSYNSVTEEIKKQ